MGVDLIFVLVDIGCSLQGSAQLERTAVRRYLTVLVVGTCPGITRVASDQSEIAPYRRFFSYSSYNNCHKRMILGHHVPVLTTGKVV